MELKFIYPDLTYNIDTIMQFLVDEQNDYWQEPIFTFYPQIDKTYYKQCSPTERRRYLETIFTSIAEENERLIHDKVNAYQAYWHLCKPQIIKALEDIFSIDLTDKLNDMHAYVTFNPISPRYLDSHSFDLFYLNSEKGAIGMAIHEIIHFVWFDVWHKLFQDTPEEYETPHLKWILSEMVVDPIMRDERLKSINPYFDSGCAYDYFYTLKIDNQPILDTLHEMLTQMSIHEFMRESYKFCLLHESEIRTHIQNNENK